tara:strand:- start:667 stop:1173 length:507 start_codon:yes stop_codon:yes gene_type:complete
MISIISKKTNKLTNEEKIKILILKNEFWKKGISSQKSWFKKNIKLSDIHNLLFVKNRLVGYTCLKLRTLKIKKKFYKYFHFDTLIVSSKLRNKGYGSLLTYFNNKVIESKNIPSFLACDKDTVKFYKKNHWSILKNKNFLLMDEDYGSKIFMMFNYIPKSKIQFWVKK